MTKLEAALAYAARGWHVLPVVQNGKIPATAHGVKDATIDQEQIKKWWAQNPELNIGIAAGEKSGVIVFDIDPRNGGESSWGNWGDKFGIAPDGAMQLTAGGGHHYLADYIADIRSCKLADGIDLLSDGRYFVAYPSEIDGRRYEWEASSDPFDGVAPFKIPEKWLQAYRDIKQAGGKKSSTQNSGLIKGNRNNGLTSLAGAMRSYGMTEAEILAALSVANETRCEMPLPASEIAQIVRSVGRYEPEKDIAADASLGADAADAILDALKSETSEYYLTRATSYLSQPSPLFWVVKNWLPDGGVAMVYGESGAGKTFITLDLACCISSGKDWHGHKTKKGVVVYLAGEGNYGIRQRVAAWCKQNNTAALDDLLISNKAIDIDTPFSASQIINAVKEITAENVAIIFIDTVNNHMSGDENSAKDTRAFLNSCNIAAKALGAAICLNHHTGHAETAKHRARGSSAWRASLDSSILVSKNQDVIGISCTKMKDAEAPKEFYGRLQPVGLGWLDEEGTEISGAVFVQDHSQPAEKKERKISDIQKDIRKFTNAWWAAGCDLLDGAPYLTKSALINYLVNDEGMSESTAKTYIKESKKGRLIYNLLTSQIIVAAPHGWTVCDNSTASTMLIRISER